VYIIRNGVHLFGYLETKSDFNNAGLEIIQSKADVLNAEVSGLT
jgi:hypothetical protein